MINSITSQFSSSMMTATAANSQRPLRPEDMFKELDTNSDGYVDKVELSALKDKLPSGGMQIDIDEMFANIDADGDGKISEAESTAHIEKMKAQVADSLAARDRNRPPQPEEMFKKLDTNSDGYVDKEEFAAIADKMPPPPGITIDIDEMFASVDTDGDGKISQAESAAHEEKMRADVSSRNPLGAAEFSSSTLASLLSSRPSKDDLTSQNLRQYQTANSEVVQSLLNIIS